MLKRVPSFLLLAPVTLGSFLLQGYHPGAEDDGIYLSAIKKDLSPGLYPFNSGFVTLQMRATVFDKAVAETVRLSHLPVADVCLLWQLAGLFLLLAGCWQIAGFCFGTRRAQLAAAMAVGSLLSLSIAGTALYIADEHLHPRLIATGVILFAITAVGRGKLWRAAFLLSIALLFHPLMAMFGISLSLIYAVTPAALTRLRPRTPRRAAILPGASLFETVTPAWRRALEQHSYYILTSWAWYEWLGAIAPPCLLLLLARLAIRRGNDRFFQLAVAVAAYSVVQLLVALCMLLPPGLERLIPLQPMRFLHLTFLLMALLAGAALGEYVLQRRTLLWLLVFVPLAGLNGYAQRLRYPATANLELPWSQPRNQWVKAFLWVRAHTPEPAVFAMDPDYLALPGEDNHSFRAIAERSSLADDEKDPAVVTQVPELAPVWLAQHNEQAGWKGWTYGDFAHLKATTPARWVLVAPAQSHGMDCPFTNPAVSVCRLP